MDDIVSYDDNDDEQTYITTRSATCCHASSSEYIFIGLWLCIDNVKAA